MTAHTCPAARNACTWQCGASSTAVIAGGTSTWLTSMLKFGTPRACARRTAMPFAGAVVSNPTPKNTTSRCGLAAAIVTASSGE
jgi:hypothetical protein